MFVALARMDTQYIIDMLEEMLGEGPLVDPKELLTADVKAKFEEAHKTEGEIAKTEGEMDLEHEVTVIKATSLLIGIDFGINPDLFPESVPVPGKSAKTGKTVNKFYYCCRVCKAHSSQNCPNMCTHTHKCLNLKTGCPLCSVTYDASDNLQNHIMKSHGGSLKPEGQATAEAAVAQLATSSMQVE